jgi:hypothetical protein
MPHPPSAIQSRSEWPIRKPLFCGRVYEANSYHVAGSCRLRSNPKLWDKRNLYIPAEVRRLYASADTGVIGQNVYRFCASEGLATVFRAALDYTRLAQTLILGAGQSVPLPRRGGAGASLTGCGKTPVSAVSHPSRRAPVERSSG